MDALLNYITSALVPRLIHGFIIWYLKRVGGSFHHNAYGPEGRYVLLLTEAAYHNTENGTNISEAEWNKYYYANSGQVTQ